MADKKGETFLFDRVEVDRKFKCDECGSHYENSLGENGQRYSYCPKGHGKLHPQIKKGDWIDFAVDVSPDAEIATKSPRTYGVEGRTYKLIGTFYGKTAYKRIRKFAKVTSIVVASGVKNDLWSRPFALLKEC